MYVFWVEKASQRYASVKMFYSKMITTPKTDLEITHFFEGGKKVEGINDDFSYFFYFCFLLRFFSLCMIIKKEQVGSEVFNKSGSFSLQLLSIKRNFLVI